VPVQRVFPSQVAPDHKAAEPVFVHPSAKLSKRIAPGCLGLAGKPAVIG
jgi:hypothetical protein